MAERAGLIAEADNPAPTSGGEVILADEPGELAVIVLRIR
jgi:hypothetical protein